jgi:hypothetical protein
MFEELRLQKSFSAIGPVSRVWVSSQFLVLLGNEKNTAVAKEFTDAMMWIMRCVMQHTQQETEMDDK